MIETHESTLVYPGVLPPPPGVTPDVNFEQSELNLITQIACIVGTTVFVLLRIFTKHVTSLGYHADDCKLERLGSKSGEISTDHSLRGFFRRLGLCCSFYSSVRYLLMLM
jgi:hypothetical protein